jgi:hypothetical protein
MTVSIRRLTLGSGYKYLMGSVAQSDGASQHASGQAEGGCRVCCDRGGARRRSISCDNSCDNLWPTASIRGHSWSVNGRGGGPPERQNRRSEGV